MAEHQKRAAQTRMARLREEIIESAEGLMKEGYLSESDFYALSDDLIRLNAVELQQTAAALRG